MQIFLEDSLPPKSPILRTPSLPLGQVSHLEDSHIMGKSNHLLTAADAVAAVDGGAAAEEVVAAAVAVAAGVVAVAGVAVGGAVGPEYQFK